MKHCLIKFFVLVCVAAIFASCSGCGTSNTQGIEFLQGDFTPPKLVSLNVLDGKTLSVKFSKKITPKIVEIGEILKESTESVLLQTFDKKVSSSFNNSSDDTISVKLDDKTESGKKYGLRGTVADNSGNTLSFASMFVGYNENLPKMIISEVRTKMSKLKVEYIEFYVQQGGNLGGMCLYNSYDGEEKRYEFPPIDVEKGEFIVLHMRTKEAGAIDELDSNTQTSTATDSSAARDLWVNDTVARIGETDVILLEERKNGKVMDALFLSDGKNNSWPKEAHSVAAARAVNDGAWTGGSGISSAVSTLGTTVTRTVGRQGDLQTASVGSSNDWFVTVSSSASPGEINSSSKYVPK